MTKYIAYCTFNVLQRIHVIHVREEKTRTSEKKTLEWLSFLRIRERF